jgi:hypothetical protein
MKYSKYVPLKLRIELSYDLAFLFLGVYKGVTYTLVFTAAFYSH